MRHRFLQRFLIPTLLAATVGGCAPGFTLGPARPPTAGPSPAASYRPLPVGHPGGTLVMADWEAPANLDPIHATTTSSLRVSSLLFAPLWGRDAESLPYPDLVQQVPTLDNHSVKVGSDGVSMTVLLKLVPGLRWSDGEPLTVDDVIFTVESVCAAGAGVRDASGFDRIIAQERHSATELLWRFGPRPAGACNLSTEITSGVFPALELLGSRARILPRHSLAGIPVREWPATPFFRHPEASSGPFAFKSSLRADLIDLVANPHFEDGRTSPGAYPGSAVRFDHGARLDGIAYRFYNSRASLVAGLRAGESDLGFHLLPEDETELRGSAGSQTVIVPTLQGEFLNPNHAVNTGTHRPPPWVDDPPVLDALARAVDRQALNSAAFGGEATVARGLFPTAMKAYRTSDGPPRPDLMGARQLLDADGWKPGAGGVRIKSGRRLEFTLLIPCGNAIRSAEQQELVREWSEGGFAVTPECIPRGRFFAAFLDHGVNAIGAFDMTLYSNTWEPDPSAWAAFGVSSQVPSAIAPGGQNWNRCADPEIDRAFSAGASGATERIRREAYLQGAGAWLRYNCTIPLLEWPAVVQRSVRLHNFVPNAGGTLDTWNAADWWVEG